MEQIKCAGLSLLAALAMTFAMQVTPAYAGMSTFSDRSRGASASHDIQQVRVNNGKRIVVNVSFRDLQRSAGGGLTVYFDTRGPDPGPEYSASGGLGPESDWLAGRIENWRGDGGQPLFRCDVEMYLSYSRDQARFSIARSCFRFPGRIRVAAYATGQRLQRGDWAPRWYQFYDWVHQ